ncbi:hypothetical protein Mpsy_0638 [Methanolobus psychrophilus R15]|nr:hypothetical protein Mpsy_0638 [Methanolobus psychrophilus R15]
MSDELVIYDDVACEPVKWFTKKKHAFLQEYFKIWIERVGSNGKSIPSLDIADLYASTGYCFCEKVDEMWKGSAILAAECLENYKGGNRLFLNSYHPSKEISSTQVNGLQAHIKKYPKTSSKCKITSLTIEQAVIEARKFINPKFPSIWILDPYRAPDLPWEVVESICTFEGTYIKKGKSVTRKPELFINLMTSGMQRNVEINPEKISIALGMEEDIWKRKYDELIAEGYNARTAIINIYTERLAEYYKKPPIVVEINDDTESAIVYCLFLCTDSDAGHYVTKLLSLPEYEKWKVFEWQPTAKRLRMGKSQYSILDFG